MKKLFVFISLINALFTNVMAQSIESDAVKSPVKKSIMLPELGNCGVWLHEDNTIEYALDVETLRERYGFQNMMSSTGMYKLGNLTGKVKDIFVSDIGQDVNPVLAILLENGKVQIFSLLESAVKGNASASNPIPGLKNIVRLSSENPDTTDMIDYVTIFAIDKKGVSHEVLYPWFDGDWLAVDKSLVPETEERITIDKEWTIYFSTLIKISKDEEEIVNYYGNAWVEIKDQGMVYYRIDERNKLSENFKNKKCTIKGKFYVEEIGYDDKEDARYLQIRPIKGLRFGIPKGKSRKFYWKDVKG